MPCCLVVSSNPSEDGRGLMTVKPLRQISRLRLRGRTWICRPTWLPRKYPSNAVLDVVLTNASGVIGLHAPSDAQGVPQLSISPEDVANAIVFLASDEAKKVNGVLMPVDNAWSTI
jgi:hypothetical protein